jgi:hypothetical protein
MQLTDLNISLSKYDYKGVQNPFIPGFTVVAIASTSERLILAAFKAS